MRDVRQLVGIAGVVGLALFGIGMLIARLVDRWEDRRLRRRELWLETFYRRQAARAAHLREELER